MGATSTTNEPGDRSEDGLALRANPHLERRGQDVAERRKNPENLPEIQQIEVFHLRAAGWSQPKEPLVCGNFVSIGGAQ